MSATILQFGRLGHATDSVEAVQGKLRAAVANTLAGRFDTETVSIAQARTVRAMGWGKPFEAAVDEGVRWAESAVPNNFTKHG